MIKNESITENATEFKPIIHVQLFEQTLNMYTYFKVNNEYVLIQYTENYPTNPDDPMSRFFLFKTLDEFANSVEKSIILMLYICSGQTHGIVEFQPQKTATKDEIYIPTPRKHYYDYYIYVRIFDKELFRDYKDLYALLTDMLQYKTVAIEVNERIT